MNRSSRCVAVSVALAAILVATSRPALADGPCGSTTFTVAGAAFPMTCIPAGSFQMGAATGERSASDWERPRHPVTIANGFWIGTTEVTQAQWTAVMGANPSTFSECGGDCPVESVSWSDVCGGATASQCLETSFVGRLNAAAGTTRFRLPTEAEWEYAARAGATTRYWFGDCLDGDDHCAPCAEADGAMWHAGNSEGGPHPVGTKSPNPWGLFDVNGNVGEWVADTFHWSYALAPADGSSWERGPYRVVRGGSWTYYALDARSAARDYYLAPYRIRFLGLRIARTAD